MRTRKFALIGAFALQALLAQVVASAQVPESRIGVLAFGSDPDPYIQTFLRELHQLNQDNGRTLSIESRYAEGRPERLPQLATDLIRLKVDLIFALGTDVAISAKNASTQVPVVFLASGDPVGVGLVSDLARPGANVTGVTLLASELSGKRLELLKELRPRISRVGVLWNPDHLDYDFEEIRASAQTLNIDLHPLEVRQAEDFENAFKAGIKARIEGLVVVPTRLTFLERKRIAEYGLTHRIPTISGWSEFAEAGGLLTYGPNLHERTRRAAVYADRILRGLKPADMPVEQPTQFELIVNTRTAKAIGVQVPQPLLLRADRVIR